MWSRVQFLASISVLVSAQAVPVDVSEVTAADDYVSDFLLTGQDMLVSVTDHVAMLSASPPFKPLWTFQRTTNLSNAQLYGDKVFTSDGLGFVYALSRHSGEVMWKTNISNTASGPPCGPRSGCRSTVAPGTGGISFVLFVNPGPPGFTGNAAIFGLNSSTGDIVWRHDAFAEGNTQINTFFAGQALILNEVSKYNPTHNMIALEPSTGRFLWSRMDEGPETFAAGLLYAKHVGDLPRLVALNPMTGSEVWSAAGAWDRVHVTQIAGSGSIILQSISEIRVLSAADGTLLWLRTGREGYGYETSMLVDDSLYLTEVKFKSRESSLTKLDLSNTMQWSTFFSPAVTGVIGAEPGVLYTTSGTSGLVRKLSSSTGEILWKATGKSHCEQSGNFLYIESSGQYDHFGLFRASGLPGSSIHCHQSTVIRLHEREIMNETTGRVPEHVDAGIMFA